MKPEIIRIALSNDGIRMGPSPEIYRLELSAFGAPWASQVEASLVSRFPCLNRLATYHTVMTAASRRRRAPLSLGVIFLHTLHTYIDLIGFLENRALPARP